jgi:hypothetical protein
VDVTWRVTFVTGGRTAELSAGESSCASGTLTWTGGTNSVMTMRFTPPPQCTPGNVTVTLWDQNRLLFEVDPDGSIEPAYEGLLRRR